MKITCREDGLVISTSDNMIPSEGMTQHEIDGPLDLVLQWYYRDGELTAADPFYYEKLEAERKKLEYQAEGNVEKANQWGLYYAKLLNNIPAEKPE